MIIGLIEIVMVEICVSPNDFTSPVRHIFCGFAVESGGGNFKQSRYLPKRIAPSTQSVNCARRPLNAAVIVLDAFRAPWV